MGRKTTLWRFQVKNKRHFTQENGDVAKKRNLKWETESPLIAAQNSAIRTKYMKARLDKKQLKRKCW